MKEIFHYRKWFEFKLYYVKIGGNNKYAAYQDMLVEEYIKGIENFKLE